MVIIPVNGLVGRQSHSTTQHRLLALLLDVRNGSAATCGNRPPHLVNPALGLGQNDVGFAGHKDATTRAETERPGSCATTFAADTPREQTPFRRPICDDGPPVQRRRYGTPARHEAG